jgi:putative Mg2+ transporter-C (MgtC) family protein
MEWLPAITTWLQDALAMHREMVLRMLLAAALGGMIGLEREASGKPAGFRTNLLICLGSALLMEISMTVAGAGRGASYDSGDPGRIAAQIVSGIGFLGAGTIMQSRAGIVTGLTTAATLWVVAAIGMAVGAQLYIPALVATTLVMITLMVLGRVEDHLMPRRASDRTINVEMANTADGLAVLEKILTDGGLVVTSMEVERRNGDLLIAYHTRGIGTSFESTMKGLLDADGVRRVALI